MLEMGDFGAAPKAAARAIAKKPAVKKAAAKPVASKGGSTFINPRLMKPMAKTKPTVTIKPAQKPSAGGSLLASVGRGIASGIAAGVTSAIAGKQPANWPPWKIWAPGSKSHNMTKSGDGPQNYNFVGGKYVKKSPNKLDDLVRAAARYKSKNGTIDEAMWKRSNPTQFAQAAPFLAQIRMKYPAVSSAPTYAECLASAKKYTLVSVGTKFEPKLEYKLDLAKWSKAAPVQYAAAKKNNWVQRIQLEISGKVTGVSAAAPEYVQLANAATTYTKNGKIDEAMWKRANPAEYAKAKKPENWKYITSRLSMTLQSLIPTAKLTYDAVKASASTYVARTSRNMAAPWKLDRIRWKAGKPAEFKFAEQNKWTDKIEKELVAAKTTFTYAQCVASAKPYVMADSKMDGAAQTVNESMWAGSMPLQYEYAKKMNWVERIRKELTIPAVTPPAYTAPTPAAPQSYSAPVSAAPSAPVSAPTVAPAPYPAQVIPSTPSMVSSGGGGRPAYQPGYDPNYDPGFGPDEPTEPSEGGDITEPVYQEPQYVAPSAYAFETPTEVEPSEDGGDVIEPEVVEEEVASEVEAISPPISEGEEGGESVVSEAEVAEELSGIRMFGYENLHPLAQLQMSGMGEEFNFNKLISQIGENVKQAVVGTAATAAMNDPKVQKYIKQQALQQADLAAAQKIRETREKAINFWEKYNKEIKIGGAILGALLIYKLMFSRSGGTTNA